MLSIHLALASAWAKAQARLWLRPCLYLVCLISLVMGVHVRAEPAGNAASVETQVKAAFLYKFGAYIDWPTTSFEKPDSPFVIGVMGSDNFADVLKQTAIGRSVNDHPVEVRKLKRGAGMNGLHVVFVASVDDAALTEVVSAAKGEAVLIVSDHGNALNNGSMINFVVIGDKVKFDIALANAEQSNLKISARLLGVARKVLNKPS